MIEIVNIADVGGYLIAAWITFYPILYKNFLFKF